MDLGTGWPARLLCGVTHCTASWWFSLNFLNSSHKGSKFKLPTTHRPGDHRLRAILLQSRQYVQPKNHTLVYP